MTRKRKCHTKSNSFVAATEQVCLQPVLDSDEADVTPLGRPFHTFARATGKARPPTVDRRQVETSSCSVEAGRRPPTPPLKSGPGGRSPVPRDLRRCY